MSERTLQESVRDLVRWYGKQRAGAREYADAVFDLGVKHQVLWGTDGRLIESFRAHVNAGDELMVHAYWTRGEDDPDDPL